MRITRRKLPIAALIPLAALTLLALILSAEFFFKAVLSFNRDSPTGGAAFLVLAAIMPAASLMLASSAVSVTRRKP